MTFQRFMAALITTAVGTALINYISQLFFPALQRFADIAWWSLGVFTVLSLLMYLAGKSAALSSNKYIFIQLIMVSIFFKMVAGVGVLLVYKKLFQPDSKLFVIPFFVVYLTFTIFETYFMTQLARMKNTPPQL